MSDERVMTRIVTAGEHTVRLELFRCVNQNAYVPRGRLGSCWESALSHTQFGQMCTFDLYVHISSATTNVPFRISCPIH